VLGPHTERTDLAAKGRSSGSPASKETELLTGGTGWDRTAGQDNAEGFGVLDTEMLLKAARGNQADVDTTETRCPSRACGRPGQGQGGGGPSPDARQGGQSGGRCRRRAEGEGPPGAAQGGVAGLN